MAETPKKPDEVFEVERIRQLIELMKEYDLSEVDLRQNTQRIRLSRGSQTPLIPAMMAPAMMPQQMQVPSAQASSGAANTTDAAQDPPHISIIKSPMVGTFYSRANPNAKNYVEVGVEVAPDSVVCIIEAMKVFNEIPAEVRGKIVAMLVKNEESVDFGKPLFKVDTRG